MTGRDTRPLATALVVLASAAHGPASALAAAGTDAASGESSGCLPRPNR